jgi:hypothetical protein
MPCGARRSVSCVARLDLVGWTIPDGVAHVPAVGT